MDFDPSLIIILGHPELADRSIVDFDRLLHLLQIGVGKIDHNPQGVRQHLINGRGDGFGSLQSNAGISALFGVGEGLKDRGHNALGRNRSLEGVG